MKRRTFIGALCAVPAALFALAQRKPEPTSFVTQIQHHGGSVEWIIAGRSYPNVTVQKIGEPGLLVLSPSQYRDYHKAVDNSWWKNT